MAQKTKYTVFSTKWGFFSFAATDEGLCHALLPLPKRSIARKTLLSAIENSIFDKNLLPSLQKKIAAYFDGTVVDFSDLRLNLTGLGSFATSSLTACRKIGYGQTVSYGQLAGLANYPRSARAVGTVLAKNPLPLIVPCHRIILSTGQIGGFSAAVGSETKLKLLRLEGYLAVGSSVT
jgi:methylated-DNA-[protein]-cysteine S-methyltransferase